MALYQHLTERGLDPFYDVESIRAGQLDTIILNQITARPYFLLVLTPGTLERCDDPRDWLRREIEQAVTTQRVIVPVHTPNFDFGDFERFLPPALGQEIRRFNGQELPQKWFKFAVQQLIEEFLLPIRIETVATPSAEQAVVDRLLQEARTAPAVTDVELSAQEYFERAFARTGDDAEGMIADYSEALRLNPRYVEAFNNRGLARLSKGDLDGAIADFEQAGRLRPDFYPAFMNIGAARFRKGDLDGVIASYSEALRRNPNLAQALIDRGLARADKGDLDGAIADYSEALRIYPDHVKAFINRGGALFDKGDVEGAIADFEQAARLAPENEDARRLLEHVTNRRKRRKLEKQLRKRNA